MHEAREVVKAKNWQNFLTQAVADINAMSRSIKPLIIQIIAQFIRDITSDMRYTIDYYIKMSRPKGKRARMYINVMWKDDRDLEKPKLRKRKLSGYIVDKEGNYIRFVPSYFKMEKPPKNIIYRFETLDKEAKQGIIKNKVNKMIAEMRKDIDLKQDSKVPAMLKFYTENMESLSNIGKRHGKKWRMTKQGREMHDLTAKEAREFETKILEKITTVQAGNNEQ